MTRKIRDAEYRKTHAVSIRASQMRWRSTEHGKRKAADIQLKWKYGISLVEYETLYTAQNGECSICGAVRFMIGTGRKAVQCLVVDHCHVSGKVRELICQRCNIFIGMLEVKGLFPKAIAYLERHKD